MRGTKPQVHGRAHDGSGLGWVREELGAMQHPPTNALALECFAGLVEQLAAAKRLLEGSSRFPVPCLLQNVSGASLSVGVSSMFA